MAWKPDFTKPDPWGGAPAASIAAAQATFVPTISNPAPAGWIAAGLPSFAEPQVIYTPQGQYIG